MKSHRVWLLGDDIDTDVLAPGAFMKGSIEELSKHCLEAVEPDFAENVKTGDVIVAGQNFGAGSSREQAALVLKLLGIEAIIAQSFGGIFFRNAFNIALPLFTVKSIQGISAGDQLVIDIETSQILNQNTDQEIVAETLPVHLVSIVRSGGLIPHLQNHLARQQKHHPQ